VGWAESWRGAGGSKGNRRGGLRVSKSLLLCARPKSRARPSIDFQTAGKEAPDPSAQRRTSRSLPVVRLSPRVSPRPVGRVYSVDGGPLGHLQTKMICIPADIGMTRRASGMDLKTPTPIAGSRTRPRAVFRTLNILSLAVFEYQCGRGVEAGGWGNSLRLSLVCVCHSVCDCLLFL